MRQTQTDFAQGGSNLSLLTKSYCKSFMNFLSISEHENAVTQERERTAVMRYSVGNVIYYFLTQTAAHPVIDFSTFARVCKMDVKPHTRQGAVRVILMIDYDSGKIGCYPGRFNSCNVRKTYMAIQ